MVRALAVVYEDPSLNPLPTRWHKESVTPVPGVPTTSFGPQVQNICTQGTDTYIGKTLFNDIHIKERKRILKQDTG